MKNTIFKIIHLLLFSFLWVGAQAQVCAPSATAVLDANNVMATFRQGGLLWHKGNGPGYVVPKDNPNQVSAISSGGFWMGGLAPNGDLQVSAHSICPEGVQAGPLINGQQDPVVCQQFDRFWEIRLDEVVAHLADFEDNGIVDNPIQNVLAWPGRNNPSSMTANGFSLPDMELAPFVDRNSNGIYEPMKGDYPAMKGQQSLWWVFSNVGACGPNHAAPKMTCAVTAYATQTNDQAISNTTYYDVRLTHEGSQPLSDFYFSIWMDADLGCPYDDFIGSYPDENFAFVYNFDENDGIPSCQCTGLDGLGISTYCEAVPMLGINWLNGLKDDLGEDLGMTSFITFNNPAFLGPPTGTIDPQTPAEHYNLMKGLWRDGTPIYQGGDGYGQFGSDPTTTYMYTGNPSDLSSWSMCNPGQDFPHGLPSYDRRLLMSSGPASIAPGEVTEFSFAIVWIPDQPHPCPSIEPMVVASQQVQEFYSAISSSAEVLSKAPMVVTLPNPVAEMVSFQATTGLTYVELLAANGTLLRKMAGNGALQLDMQRNGLPTGIYFYKATLVGGQVETGKLVMK
ncbi:MAG: T9SS type A sorting domain-containing protein [Saprospiraceae bacterium]|nr:T9SS type A sorting domain-containing protein [Saprospiraceae bacterium]